MNSLQLTPFQVAERWNITTKTLSQWRYNGQGPRYSKVSRLITYWLSDIEEYENSKLCRSTSEYPLKALEKGTALEKEAPPEQQYLGRVTPLLKKRG